MTTTKKDNCFKCKHKRNIPGDLHIRCNKPDSNMQGKLHGIRNGWFFYPINFDPTWKAKECQNFEAKGED